MSKVCNEWLLYLNDPDLIHEKPLFIHNDETQYTNEQVHAGKFDSDTGTDCSQHNHIFTPDAVRTKKGTPEKPLTVDMFMVDLNVILNAN